MGDIAYADAWLKEETGGYIKPLNTSDHGAVYDRILNEFYDEIEPISRDVPYMVGPGENLPAPSPGMLIDVAFKGIMKQIVITALTLPSACPAS